MSRSNFGTFMKGVAIFILVIAAIASLIGSIAITNVLSYRGFNFFLFLLIFIGLIASSALLYMVLYGIGDSVDVGYQNQEMLQELNTKLKGAPVSKLSEAAGPITSNRSISLSSIARPASHDWKCPDCGKVNRSISNICSCGYEKK